ncbi:hypothetical protein [Candidatus Methylopumilus universalis]|uniref:hypothetical protein n=1 Tax=Candidatus Methylopumilus universalis TaxID=2588536 RepID=UPI003BEEF177
MMPIIIIDAPKICQASKLSFRKKTPVSIVPMIREPAAIGKANDNGIKRRITIQIRVPTP